MLHLPAGANKGQRQALPNQAFSGSNLNSNLGSKTVPYVQPGCNVMFLPGQWCLQRPSPFVRGCCTPGHTCTQHSQSLTGFSCQPVPKQQLLYSYEQQAKGSCRLNVDVGGQCGGAGGECYSYKVCDQFGPWAGFCCPNGYTCQPVGRDFRVWTCQVDIQDQPPGEPYHSCMGANQAMA